jgi:hypothetical protein
VWDIIWEEVHDIKRLDIKRKLKDIKRKYKQKVCPSMSSHVFVFIVDVKSLKNVYKKIFTIINCDYGQCYLFDRPLTVTDFEKKYLAQYLVQMV